MVPIEQSSNVINTTLLGLSAWPETKPVGPSKISPGHSLTLCRQSKISVQINAWKKDESVVLFDYAGQVTFNMFVKSWLNFTEEFLFYLMILILRNNICRGNVNAVLSENQNMLFL